MESRKMTVYDLLKENSSRRSSKLSTSGQTPTHHHGLTTREALSRLHSDMDLEISQMKSEFSGRKLSFWLRESISFKSELSKMRWPSVMFMTAQALAHLIVGFILDLENLATSWVGFQGLILITLLIINLATNVWDTKLRFMELLMKSEHVLILVKRCSQDKKLLKHWRQYNWNSAHAKMLFIPKSPCINQTLTYRDRSCLNLPDYLLVKDDIIHLYPGERAPGDCIALKSTGKEICDDKILLQEGQMFHEKKSENDLRRNAKLNWSSARSDEKSSDIKDPMIQFGHARLTDANRGTDFLMLSTPYIKSLRTSLQRSHKRPVNSVEKECFVISRKYFETFVIPAVFILSTVVTAIHYGYLDLTDSDQKIKTISIAYLLLRPSLTIMPFLPWMLPCFWLAVNAYGSARLLCCAEAQRKRTLDVTGAYNRGYISGGIQKTDVLTPDVHSNQNLLSTPNAAAGSDIKHEDEELNDLNSSIKFTTVFKVFIDLIKGKSGHVWRSSSLLQVLGCLTSLCCIDKVGILSWSNPTPDKVFVLTKNQTEESRFSAPHHEHLDETESQNQTDVVIHQQTLEVNNDDEIENPVKNSTTMFQNDPSNTNSGSQFKHQHLNRARPEVLDVSQTINSYRGFNDNIISQQLSRLQFDDLNWSKHMSNLRPLGLAILMNNCCEDSFGDYFRFHEHISYESILRCNLTPVIKRRCICGLSKLIGFSKDTVKNYKFINQIGIYKLIDLSLIKKGKLVSSLENTTRLKLPFPNMTCNIHRDVATGSYQAFSQGTADIVLDACVEFWDGWQLIPLDESTKKKIMDFYHRTSLTSYCSAFSYTPLLEAHNLGDHYIELPPENSKFAPHLRKLANEHQEEFLRNQLINLPDQSNEVIHNNGSHPSSQNILHQGNMSEISLATCDKANPKACNQITRRHLSVEELCRLVESPSSESKQCCIKKDKKSKKNRKLIGALDELTDQVFVGMVAMQYQACTDFVALVEQLEHACIRFVHFSKENELRSRVFSEKMGLESGWNCHISLQSDENLNDVSTHQPSAIKIEFQEDASKLKGFTPTTRVTNILAGSEKFSVDDTTSGDDLTSSDKLTLYSWKSLPSLVMQLTGKTFTEQQGLTNRTRKSSAYMNHSELPSVCHQAPESEYGDELINEVDISEDSAKDEGFESLAFDMSNRAKLPKGVENIRPHLETVDNVPLQVSLFTDCTPDLTKEMIEIMQDYGEIVCVIGSSSSRSNTLVFLQANASIAIEPWAPQSCTRNDNKIQRSLDKRRMKQRKRHDSEMKRAHKVRNEDESEFISIHVNPRPNNPRDRLGIGPTEIPNRVVKSQRQVSPSSSSSSSSSPSSSCSSSPNHSDYEFNDDISVDEDEDSTGNLVDELPDPSSLASKLASLPCSYNYSRREPVNLYSLIMEARHFTFKMKNTFVCMICFAMSISAAQFLASILFLPPMFSSGLTIWLTVVVVPLMSFSLMSTTKDSQVMKIAVGKNLQLKPENITFFVICYLVKFIPSIIVVVLCFGLIIAHSCKLTGFGSSSLGPCWMFTYVQHGNATSSDIGDQEDLLWSTHLLTAQVCAAFLIVLYFVVISSEFVHRSQLMWQRSPTRNRIWVIISLVLILGQLLYNQVVLKVNLSSSDVAYQFLVSLPPHIWIISLIWPIIVIGVNLLVKRAEIKATIRQQRRARFDFNTKLGMNSPF